MKIKTKGILTSAAITVLIALFVVLALFIGKPTTASAETASTQAAIFSYTYHIDNTDNDLSENNVSASHEVRSSDDGEKCEVSFLFNTAVVTNTDEEIWINNVGSKSLRIRAISNFNITSFEVRNSFGASIYSISTNMCNITIDDGEYYIIYKGSSTWAEMVDGQKEVRSANIECIIRLNVDTTPPTMESSLDSFEIDTNKGFAVIAKDINETKLYYKKPNMVNFELAPSDMLVISQNSPEGKYYFYAVDSLNNRTSTHWINLKDTVIDFTMTKSDHDNSICFSWEGDELEATIDGKPYEKSTWIRTEGNHVFRLSNGSGKEKVYDFTIDHYYEQKEFIAPSCTTEGKSVYYCVQCGYLYEKVEPATGHQYTVTTIPSTCTESEHITFICNVCNTVIEKEGDYPTGHNYVIEIVISPTCTTDGLRRSTCEQCGYSFDTKIAANGHNYNITDTTTNNGITTRTYVCAECGDTYKQELGDQYEEVANYVEYLFQQYEPYMWWVLLAVAGIWSIVIGVMIAIAQKNEDKEKARKMLINYVIGLIIIAIIVVAAPFLIRGIASLVT